MSQALSELDRRLANILRVGTIAELDQANARVKVDCGDFTTDWLPWSTPAAGGDRVWTTPDIGEQVMVMSPSGEMAQGVVGPSMFQDASPENGNDQKDRRTTYKDGTVIEYDRDAHVLNATLNPAGTMNVTIGSAKIEMNTSRIKFTVGGSSIEITAAGVTTTAPRIDWNS